MVFVMKRQVTEVGQRSFITKIYRLSYLFWTGGQSSMAEFSGHLRAGRLTCIYGTEICRMSVY